MKSKSLFLLLFVAVIFISGCIGTEDTVQSYDKAVKEKIGVQDTKPICTPNWQCTTWSECSSNSKQTRICTDSNNCGVTSNKLSESQNCTYIAPVVYYPEYITLFKIEKDSGILIPYFALEDKAGTNTLGEGKANIQIKNADGKLVFTQEINFKPSDFMNITQNNLKIYLWTINTSDIQKGNSYSGTADLIITLSNGKIIKDTYSGFSIPSYSDTELKQMWVDEYNKNAKISREVVSKGNFEVTLVKYGFYTHRALFTGKERSDFRVDIKVKNIGSELKCFETNDAKIISGLKQYKEDSLYSAFPSSAPYSGCMDAGFLEEGYIVYTGGTGENDVVPHNLTGQIKINVGIDEYTKGVSSYEFIVSL